MRAVISTLVATAVALHSVLGCCWHHAHESDLSAAEPATLLVADHDDHEHEDASLADEYPCGCPHDHEDHLAGDQPAGPAEDAEHGDSEHGKPCPNHCPGPCADKCLLVAAPRVQLEHDVSAVLPAAVLSVRQSSLELEPSPADFADHDAATYPPPERLHLLHQRLLI